MDKKQLRADLLAKRKALTVIQRGIYDAAILHRLTELEEMKRAKTILLYLDFRGEAKSAGMIEWSLAEGKRVCAPVTAVEERKIIPVQMTDLNELSVGAYGIREPLFSEDAVVPVEEIDAIVIPGVGFDRQGGRLGYGGGYYDRFLPHVRPDCCKIAVAYDCQVVPAVPLEPHDTLLDLLVTEKGVWHTRTR